MSYEILNAPWANASLRKAVEELQRMEGDEQMRALYEAKMDQLYVLATQLEGSYEEGIEQCIEKGRDEATQLLARKLLQKGQSLEFVSDLTGLGLEQLRALGA